MPTRCGEHRSCRPDRRARRARLRPTGRRRGTGNDRRRTRRAARCPRHLARRCRRRRPDRRYRGVVGRATKVVAVEAEGSPTLDAAWRAGEPVDIETSGVAVDSLGARRIGALAWEQVEAGNIAERIVVSGDDILAARQLLWRELRIVAETGASATAAALLTGAYAPVVVSVSGCSCAAATLTLWISRNPCKSTVLPWCSEHTFGRLGHDSGENLHRDRQRTHRRSPQHRHCRSRLAGDARRVRSRWPVCMRRPHEHGVVARRPMRNGPYDCEGQAPSRRPVAATAGAARAHAAGRLSYSTLRTLTRITECDDEADEKLLAAAEEKTVAGSKRS